MFGSHLSVAGGLVNALHEAERLRFDTVQVFTKNQRQWASKPLDSAAASEWNAELARLGWRGRPVAHNSYLVNMASPDESGDGFLERSIESMRDEIERCAALGIPFLVAHPGAHLIKDGPLSPEQRVEHGLVRIAASMKRLLRETRGMAVTVCLENTAGGGTNLGRTFEELARLRQLILAEAGPDADLPGPDQRGKGGRVGFCVDTCHALAAGYDIAADGPPPGDPAGRFRRRTFAEAHALGRALLERIDALCGLANLRVLHLNDSLGALGSRLDRHAHIGQGKVAPGAFAAIVSDPRLAALPMILETPKEPGPDGQDMDITNLAMLRQLAALAEHPEQAADPVPSHAAAPKMKSPAATTRPAKPAKRDATASPAKKPGKAAAKSSAKPATKLPASKLPASKKAAAPATPARARGDKAQVKTSPARPARAPTAARRRGGTAE